MNNQEFTYNLSESKISANFVMQKKFQGKKY